MLMIEKKKKVGRPKRSDIDAETVEKLAELQCTLVEIAAFFDCDIKTISNNFSNEVAKGREKGKISLRRKQFKLADKSPAMCIWLGKQYLGQTEKIVLEEKELFESKLELMPEGKDVSSNRYKQYLN